MFKFYDVNYIVMKDFNPLVSPRFEDESPFNQNPEEELPIAPMAKFSIFMGIFSLIIPLLGILATVLVDLKSDTVIIEGVHVYNTLSMAAFLLFGLLVAISGLIAGNTGRNIIKKEPFKYRGKKQAYTGIFLCLFGIAVNAIPNFFLIYFLIISWVNYVD